MGSINKKSGKTNTAAGASTQKLILLGSGLGLAILLGERFANTVGGWIYTLIVGSSGTSFNMATVISNIADIAAFIILFAGARTVFKQAGLQRANHIAATSIITTYMLAGLFMVAIKVSGAALFASQIILFVLVGGFATLILARLFGRIKDDERAALIVFTVIIVALLGVGWLTDYFQQNSKLILGY